MPNIGLNTQIYPFFNSVKEPLTEDKTSDSYHSGGYDSFTLEFGGEGSATIVVEGCVNTRNSLDQDLKDAECSWYPLAALNAQDYSKSAAISNKGIYFFGISGVSRIRVKATGVSGEVTIVGAFTK